MTLCLELDDETKQQLKYRAEQSEFDSTEEYISYVLRQVAAPAPEVESINVNHKREEEVMDQLKSLGYLE